MKSLDDEIYLVHDDTEVYDVKQLTPEELAIYESVPDLPQEKLTEILLSSMI